MEVKIKKKDIESAEEDLLPEEDIPVNDEKLTRERKLELELAEQRGELKALRNNSGGGNGQMSLEQTKQFVFQDVNNLSDEDFSKKYKTSKHSASMTVMDADNRQTKAEARQLHAESTVSVKLAAKYSDFGRYQSEIDLSDLSESARQDPEKLAKFMERQYLALSKEDPSPRKDPSRRKVASDFERPAVIPAGEDKTTTSENDEIVDEIPAESDISNQKLGRLMGIHSEKERKELAGKNLIYVDMDLGGGYRFKDPKKGFEKVVQKVA